MMRLRNILICLTAALGSGLFDAGAQHTLTAVAGTGISTARFYPDEETRTLWGAHDIGVSWRYYSPTPRFVGAMGADLEYIRRGFSLGYTYTTEIVDEMKDKHVEKISEELTAWADDNDKEIERLKQTEKFRKQYLGNVAHELKTPIFNIQGYISTLLDGGLEDELINRKYLERAEKSIDRLINIVNDLDTISKLENDMNRLKPDRFDIVALAKEIADQLEMEAAKRKIKISVKGADSLPSPFWVTADKHYVGQVLVNLIINSIHYGKEGGATRIKFRDMMDKILIEVEDTGVGIGKEDIPRVFERFYRVDKGRSREQGGTGLGLAIVKHIVEAHGERITVRSELGVGTTFAFPLKKAATPEK